MDLTTVYDCIGAKLPSLTIPPGVLLAGYITGSGDVPWTDQQMAAHPDAVRIDQSPVNTPADETADVYDLEPRAGTFTGLAEWIHGAWANYQQGRRVGQRTPCLYASRSNITPAVNTLLAAGITHGVNLWIADETPIQEAIDEVTNASGPFPVIGRQYEFHTDYDVSIVSTAWLNNVSKAPITTQQPVNHPHPPAPPGEWKDWVMMAGIGLDGNVWGTAYNPENGTWTTPSRFQ